MSRGRCDTGSRKQEVVGTRVIPTLRLRHVEQGKGVNVRAGISFHGGELEAELRGDLWTVRLGELEATSRWLDFALSQVLDDDPRRVHELAAKLIEQMLVERAPVPGDHAETRQPPP